MPPLGSGRKQGRAQEIPAVREWSRQSSQIERRYFEPPQPLYAFRRRKSEPVIAALAAASSSLPLGQRAFSFDLTIVRQLIGPPRLSRLQVNK